MKKNAVFVIGFVVAVILIYYILPKQQEMPCDYISVKQILTEKFPEYILDKSSDFTDEICLVGKDDSEHCFEYQQTSDGVCRLYENYSYGKIVTKINESVEVDEYMIDHYNGTIKYLKTLTAQIGPTGSDNSSVVNIKQRLRDNYTRVRYGYFYEYLGDNFSNFVDTNSPISVPKNTVIWIQQNLNTINKARVWVYDGVWGTANVKVFDRKKFGREYLDHYNVFDANGTLKLKDSCSTLVKIRQLVAGVVVFKDPSKTVITEDDYYVLLNRAGTGIRNYLIPVSFKTYLSYLRFMQGNSDGWDFEEDVKGNGDAYLRYVENIEKKTSDNTSNFAGNYDEVYVWKIRIGVAHDNHFMQNDLNDYDVEMNFEIIPTLKI